jgi:hypothetical protein
MNNKFIKVKNEIGIVKEEEGTIWECWFKEKSFFLFPAKHPFLPEPPKKNIALIICK